MNNDAFQKLVRERSNVKSSKEIAREAVQEEFRKKRGRQQQRRGGGSDDDDDVGSSDEDRRPKRQLDKRNKNRNDEDGDEKQKDKKQNVDAYRDRAKERRETSGMKQSTDAAHVLVKKGLDLNLARSFKKQSGRHQGHDKKEEACFVQNREEALQFISSGSSSSSTTSAAPIKSELGKEMLDYLRATYLKDTNSSSDRNMDSRVIAATATPAGMAIQQSVLTFSIQANPGDTARAWEVPREQTYASLDCRRLYEKASPCNNVLVLDSMEKVLQRNNINNTRRQQTTTATAAVKKSKQSQDDDDSDDDIFGNVGEYDPIAEMNPDNNDDKNEDDKGRPKVDKGSLFEQDNSKDAALQQDSIAAPTSVAVEEQCREGDEYAAPSSSTRLVGLSSTSYGDEMDVDFDGRIQDEEEEEGNKKKKKKRKRKKGSGSDED